MHTVMMKVIFDIYDMDKGHILPTLSQKSSTFLKIEEHENIDNCKAFIEKMVKQNGLARSN